MIDLQLRIGICSDFEQVTAHRTWLSRQNMERGREVTIPEPPARRAFPHEHARSRTSVFKDRWLKITVFMTIVNDLYSTTGGTPPMSATRSLLQRWRSGGDKPAGAEHLLQSLFVMAWMVEARDPYTGGHLWRVSQYSLLLAQEAGLPDADVARITLGGFLHDLGKISVPDAILNKPGHLSDKEYEIIKTHPEVGARLLAGHPLAPLAHAAVLHHHERPDGAGYPQRLVGTDVPLDARLVGICDAFDAMTSSRPYRRGMTIAQALGIIENNLDQQFDRILGASFLTLGHAGTLDHIAGHTDHGIPLQECPVCGPTIVVRRNQNDGDRVYCRNCGSEAEVSHQDGEVCAIPTGRTGSARDLEPEADLDIIGELVRASTSALRAGTL